jgi:uncharacterized NAD(P)/FAD-binding protein YdhS
LVYDVAVVGSGFSAIAVTINLLRLLPASRRIAVIGDDPGFGRGTAYRTEFYVHRLNVPAGRMSLFPDRPDDFLKWLEDKGRDISLDDFASRGDYGLYLRDRLASLLRDRADRPKVDFIRAKATGCVEDYPIGMVFHLNDADELAARGVVLCLGVGNAALPLPLEGIPAGARTRLIENPWKLGWLQQVRPTDQICILGSGLTMIDQILALRARGHRGKIHVLSRRGLIPHPHLARRAAPIAPKLPEDSRQVSAMLAALRRQVDGGDDWRAVIDGLRPQTQRLWQQMTPEQRSRFLRHALPWWNIHRHRISPRVFQQFASLMQNGTIIIHAGFLKAIETHSEGTEVFYRPRGTDRRTSFRADWIVNCTGMERSGIEHSPLLRQMQKEGFIRADELGLGIVVDTKSRIVDGKGELNDRMYAVGALTAGQFWEITAVPDIRVQASEVAAAIAASIA